MWQGAAAKADTWFEVCIPVGRALSGLTNQTAADSPNRLLSGWHQITREREREILVFLQFFTPLAT